MSDVPYVLVPTAPSLDEYLHLRSRAGMGAVCV